MSEVDISERGQVWQRNKQEKQERMKKELNQKNNRNCTFIPKTSKSKSAHKKSNYNASRFVKEGLSEYFQRIERAKKLKNKSPIKRNPPPLNPASQINSNMKSSRSNTSNPKYPTKKNYHHESNKYESKVRNFEMQKTEEDIFKSNKHQLFGNVNSSRHNPDFQSHEIPVLTNISSRNPYSQDRILQDLSKQTSIRGNSPPNSSGFASGDTREQNAFAVNTKQLIQGLFSSNETGAALGFGNRSKDMASDKYIQKGFSPRNRYTYFI